MNACCYCKAEFGPGDLRPYGPKGAMVCFHCGTSDEHIEETRANIDAHFEAAIATGGTIVINGDTNDGPIAIGGRQQ